MKPRFFVSQQLPEKGFFILKDRDVSHQLKNVLRLRAGERVVLLDNSGYEYECAVSDIKNREAGMEVIERREIGNQGIELALYQSVIKKDKMEWVFQKCTEIGAAKFVPVISAHSVKLGVNLKRSEIIIKEAAEQSGRSKLPVLFDPVSFGNAIEIAKNSGGLNILAHNIGDHVSLKYFCERKDLPLSINLFIGPEGGYSEEEVSLARENDFQIVSLGKRILRAETAAIAASYFLIA